MIIEKKNNSVVISLNQELYDSECISESISEFSSLEGVSIKKEKTGPIIINSEKEDPVIVAYEFGNYVLALMKNKGLV